MNGTVVTQLVIPEVRVSIKTNQYIKNAMFARKHAHFWLRSGNKRQFHVWMQVARRSIRFVAGQLKVHE